MPVQSEGLKAPVLTNLKMAAATRSSCNPSLKGLKSAKGTENGPFSVSSIPSG